MKRRQRGFSLIELVVMIVVLNILMVAIFVGIKQSLLKTPTVHYEWEAMQMAKQCMEWFLEQRRINGYSSITCPSTPTPTECAALTGYTVTTTVTCTTWDSDTAFQTIKVAVTGLGNATLSLQIGSF